MGFAFYCFLSDHIIGVINNQAVKWHIETTLKNLVLNNLHKHNKYMHSNVSVKTSAKMPCLAKIDLRWRMISFVEVVININSMYLE